MGDNNPGLVQFSPVWILISLALFSKPIFPDWSRYLVHVMVGDILIPPIPSEAGQELSGHTHC